MALTGSSMGGESLDTSFLSKILTYDVPPGSHVTFALFSGVQNMNELRKCVMGGEFEAALLKTSMVSFFYRHVCKQYFVSFFRGKFLCEMLELC